MLARLFYRLRQFQAGMFSKYLPEDELYAKEHLSGCEFELFSRLPVFEKKHAVIVARKMEKAGGKYPALDANKLIKLGLLHDIGKIHEKNSIFTKSILVIIRYFFPGGYNFLAQKGRTNRFFRRYYLHKHHGEVGAELLTAIGESAEFIMIIKKHDPKNDPFMPDDPLPLKILQDADSSY